MNNQIEPIPYHAVQKIIPKRFTRWINIGMIIMLFPGVILAMCLFRQTHTVRDIAIGIGMDPIVFLIIVVILMGIGLLIHVAARYAAHRWSQRQRTIEPD